jgi:hypothetical protein
MVVLLIFQYRFCAYPLSSPLRVMSDISSLTDTWDTLRASPTCSVARHKLYNAMFLVLFVSFIQWRNFAHTVPVFHTSVQDLKVNGVSDAPTSEARIAVMLILMMAGSYKVPTGGGLQTEFCDSLSVGVCNIEPVEVWKGKCSERPNRLA